MAEQIDWYETGLDTLKTLGWAKDRSNVPVSEDIDQAFWNHTIEQLWGRIWGRPGLSMRDRQMVSMTVLVSIGSEFGIENHLRFCHNVGLTEEEVRELIMITGYYSGWPRFAVLNKKFNEILAEPNSTWPKSRRMKLPPRGERPKPDNTDWYAVGLKVVKDLGWTKTITNVHPTAPDLVDQAFWNHTIENLWGRIYGRPGLSLRDREMIVIAALISANTELGISGHLKNCHAVGLTEQQVREILIQAGYYAGWPKFAHNTVTFNRILKDPNSTWPKSMRMKLPARGERPNGTVAAVAAKPAAKAKAATKAPAKAPAKARAAAKVATKPAAKRGR